VDVIRAAALTSRRAAWSRLCSRENDFRKLSTLRFVKAPEAKRFRRLRSDTVRHLLSIRKFLLCNHCRTLEQAPTNTAIRFGIFFMSHVRPILAAFALFSHDTHAALSRDPEFQVGFRERSSPPPIAITGHLSYAQQHFFHNFLDLPLCCTNPTAFLAFRALSTVYNGYVLMLNHY